MPELTEQWFRLRVDAEGWIEQFSSSWMEREREEPVQIEGRFDFAFFNEDVITAEDPEEESSAVVDVILHAPGLGMLVRKRGGQAGHVFPEPLPLPGAFCIDFDTPPPTCARAMLSSGLPIPRGTGAVRPAEAHFSAFATEPTFPATVNASNSDSAGKTTICQPQSAF
jgi:hypothetical protein